MNSGAEIKNAADADVNINCISEYLKAAAAGDYKNIEALILTTDIDSLINVAIERNLLNFLKILHEKGCLAKVKHKVIFTAVERDAIEVVDFIIDIYPRIIYIKSFYLESTPLWVAVSLGKYDIAKLLIQKGATINAFSKIDKGTIMLDDDMNNGRKFVSTLWIAAYNGEPSIVNLLLESNYPILGDENSRGETPLWAACRAGHIDVVKVLIDKFGMSMIQNNIGDDDAESPLQVALASMHVDIFKYLYPLVLAMKHECFGYEKYELLLIACQHGLKEAFDILVECKSLPVFNPNALKAALYKALEFSQVAIARSILDLDEKFIGSSDVFKILQDKAGSGDLKVVALLIEYGFHEQKSDLFTRPLILAVTNNHLDVAKLLTTVCDTDFEKSIALAIAAVNGSIEMVDWLILTGADVHIALSQMSESDLSQMKKNANHETISKLLFGCPENNDCLSLNSIGFFSDTSNHCDNIVIDKEQKIQAGQKH